jgi:uncharacterized protein YdbL (DUF1318 family)
MTMMTYFKPLISGLKTAAAAFSGVMLLSGAAITVMAVNPPAAHAQSAKAIVDSALAGGVIGETISGYLAPVGGAVVSQGVRNAMNEINIGRKSAYTRLAREQNLSVEVVAALTGEKQIAKAPRGHKILDRSGVWKTK